MQTLSQTSACLSVVRSAKEQLLKPHPRSASLASRALTEHRARIVSLFQSLRMANNLSRISSQGEDKQSYFQRQMAGYAPQNCIRVKQFDIAIKAQTQQSEVKSRHSVRTKTQEQNIGHDFLPQVTQFQLGEKSYQSFLPAYKEKNNRALLPQIQTTVQGYEIFKACKEIQRGSKLNRGKLCRLLLMRNKFFRLLGEDITYRLVQTAIIHTIRPYSQTIKRGALIEEVWFVLYGRLREHRKGQGLEILLCEGDIFGEQIVFQKQNNSKKFQFSLVTELESAVLKVSRGQLIECLAEMQEPSSDEAVQWLRKSLKSKRQLMSCFRKL